MEKVLDTHLVSAFLYMVPLASQSDICFKRNVLFCTTVIWSQQCPLQMRFSQVIAAQGDKRLHENHSKAWRGNKWLEKQKMKQRQAVHLHTPKRESTQWEHRHSTSFLRLWCLTSTSRTKKFDNKPHTVKNGLRPCEIHLMGKHRQRMARKIHGFFLNSTYKEPDSYKEIHLMGKHRHRMARKIHGLYLNSTYKEPD